MDTTRIKELISKREAIDEEIICIVNGETKEKKTINCGNCGEPGHSTRTCTKPKVLHLPTKQ